MVFRRLQHRAVMALLILLMTVGCGTLSRNAEAPLNTAPPEEPQSTALPSPTPASDAIPPVDPTPATDEPTTTAPQDEAPTYHVVLASLAGLQVEVPEAWVSEGAGAVWTPAPGDARRVGVTRADLVPPAEAEAVLLPGNARILESEAVEMPLGTARRFKLEVYGATSQGDGAKADVASVEVHVLVVVAAEGMRTGYDFFAAAPTAEALELLMPVLSHMMETAKYEVAVAQPDDGYDHIPAVDSAKTRLGEHLSIPADTIRVVSVEAVDWPDACIGIHKPGQMCAQVITSGYRIIVDVNGRSYELHTNASGSVVGIVP